MTLSQQEIDALMRGGADLTPRDLGDEDPRAKAAQLRADLFAGAEMRPEQMARLAALAPGLDAILGSMSESLDPLEIHGWLVMPNPDLFVGADQTALSVVDYLKAGGNPAPVIAAAAQADIMI